MESIKQRRKRGKRLSLLFPLYLFLIKLNYLAPRKGEIKESIPFIHLPFAINKKERAILSVSVPPLFIIEVLNGQSAEATIIILKPGSE